MARFLGLDRLFSVFQIMYKSGGIRASLYKLYRMDELKLGTLIGTDNFGNKYYQDDRNFYGRNRWVEYAPHFGMDYDGSQVPAQWFGWLHYKTDLPPHEDPTRPCYKWMAEHTENMSGKPGQYYPYSTTRPKIEAWDPKKPLDA